MIPVTRDYQGFQRAVYAFYARNGRHGLPWRNTADPYRILLSEVMLQQTQVSRVISRYEQFLDLFPTFSHLAEAQLRDVLAAWSGLGYNRRARFLHELARVVLNEYGGRLPEPVSELRKLPGVGDYTASAVACFAFGKPEVCIETNIRRAIIYSFFAGEPHAWYGVFLGGGSYPVSAQPELYVSDCIPDFESNRFPLTEQQFQPRSVPAAVSDRDVRSIAEKVLDPANPRKWNYALMDYGEAIGRLVPNPNRHSAHYVKQSPFKGSKREIRGAMIRILSSVDSATITDLSEQTGFSISRIRGVLEELQTEGFVQRGNSDRKWRIFSV